MEHSINKLNFNFWRRLFIASIGVLLVMSSLACNQTPEVANANNASNENNKTTQPATPDPAALAKAKQGAEATVNGILNVANRSGQKRDNPEAAVADARADFDKYYDENVTIIDSSGFTKGLATYRDKNLGPQFKTLAGSGAHKIADLSVNALTPDTAVATYRYTVDVQLEGKPTPIFGYGTLVLQQKGNAWKVVHQQTAGRPMKETDPRF